MSKKGLCQTALICGSLVSMSALLSTTSAHAGTLVTCGPNGAASIVKIVPAGCRHLAATSAPNSSPDNPVEESRLGFVFRAYVPDAQEAQPVAVEQDINNTENVATLQQR
ncbi:hypothetical protein ACSYAD_30820 [Acaryochloris marina NIES-2412]|uniref:hypothetical protein n=1 Tax=Acaryochloris marina TaxID=155978 RepID=UPI004058C1C5